MPKAKEDDICYSPDCIYGPREHYHVLTPHGSYVKFIIRSKDHANTRGQWESHTGKDEPGNKDY